MVDLVWFQLLSAALFVIGLYGVMARRSAVLIVMSIELMLNAVNINLNCQGQRDAISLTMILMHSKRCLTENVSTTRGR